MAQSTETAEVLEKIRLDGFVDVFFTSYETVDEPHLRVSATDINSPSNFVWRERYNDPEYKPAKPSCQLYLFGRLRNGKSVAIEVKIWPRIVLEVLQPLRESEISEKVAEMLKRTKIDRGEMMWELQYRTPAAGFYLDSASETPRRGKKPYVVMWLKSQALFWKVKRDCDYRCKDVFEPTETNVPHITQFLLDCNAKPCSIIRIPAEKLVPSSAQRFSTCDLEFTVKHTLPHQLKEVFQTIPDENFVSTIPIRILSFDIEVASDYPRFPDAQNPLDEVISICATVEDMASGERTTAVIGLKQAEPLPDITFQVFCESESEVLENFRKFVVETDPDFVIGYNIDGFDWKYLFDRAERVCKPGSPFPFMSRIILYPSAVKEKTFSSKQQGSSVFRTLQLVGRVNADLYTQIKNEYTNFKILKLSHVAKTLLDDKKENQKIDLSIEIMNLFFKSGDPKKLAEIHKYCLQDTLVPLLIWRKLENLATKFSMSRVTNVFPNDLFQRGQSFKVWVQLATYARQEGYVLNKLPEFKNIDSVEGATVLDPIPGFYLNVSALDFASLYPSIMRKHNLSFDSIIFDHATLKQLDKKGVKYKIFKTGIGEVAVQQTFESLLSKLLRKLGEERSLAKKEMKDAIARGDTDSAKINNGRQLALKISANSIYGFTGAPVSQYYCPLITATVTSIGRGMIADTKNFVEKNYSEAGATVIYGDTDSVFVTFPEIADTEDGFRQKFRLADEIAEAVTLFFGEDRVIVLENEKTFTQLILLKKKKYIGYKVEHPNDSKKIDRKGVMDVRRDYSDFQQKVYSKVTTLLLNSEGYTQEAIDFLESSLNDLINGKVSIEDLTLTRRLAGSYKNPNVPQNIVTQKIEQRNPGSGPRPGDRVSFVPIVLSSGHDKAKFFERVDDPEYVTKNNVPIDYAYYVETFLSAMVDLFRPFSGGETKVKNLIRSYSERGKAKVRNIRSLKDFGFFKKESVVPSVEEPLAPSEQTPSSSSSSSSLTRKLPKKTPSPPRPHKKNKTSAPNPQSLLNFFQVSTTTASKSK